MKDFCFGIHPVLEAIRSGKTIDKLFVQKGLKGDLAQELMEEIRVNRIRPKMVPIEKLNRITRKNHQGVIAFVSPVPFYNLGDTIQEVFESGETPFFLMLDGITDIRNFGAICRTAECAGVHGIIIPEIGAAQINADALKTSAGALHQVKIIKERYLDNSVEFLQNSGIQVIGCTEKTKDLYTDLDYKAPLAIIMGSEESGISEAVMKKLDGKAKLPLHGEIGSLNVSVAAGVILYEVLRQRN